ncbi:MAG: glycosyltransferase [Thomasclavelia ramosa]
MAKSKLMIMTSRTEGTPMSALESLTLGKPIVSTPTDGLNELITNNINGFLSND